MGPRGKIGIASEPHVKHQGSWPRVAQGFTLIEILAVVIIIGLLASMVSLSVDRGEADQGAHKEALLLRQALDYISDRAVLNGEILAMFVEPKVEEEALGKRWCYRWQRFRSEQWQDLPENTLSEHCMAETVQMDLMVEGKLVVYDPDLETQPPVLVWSPSGEATPIEITLYENGSSEKKVIAIGMMGEIEGPEREGDDSDKP